uniref:diphthine methyl ester synthase n=1 Tax=Mesocestoides corti TaxID=53468 RepID=A0A5K3F047_MESCO
MLYVIGLGLSSVEDISVSGLTAAKACDHIFVDAYTSILSHGIEKISLFLGKSVRTADREFTEGDSVIVSLAKKEDVAFLVVGDPLCATTHTDIILRAIKEKIPYKVIHNSSIMTAVACCGIHLYHLGETVSIPLWGECGCPDSFYSKIMSNYCRGLHTLCLLDIRVKEKSVENLLRDRDVYEPPRFMLCQEAAYQILEAGRRIRQRFLDASDPDCEVPYEREPDGYLHEDCIVICLARVATPSQAIVVTTIGTLEAAMAAGDSDPISASLGGPMHCMIIPGRLHPMEVEFLSASLLTGDLDDETKIVTSGTRLPILLPPSRDRENFKEIVTAMFSRHQELLNPYT